MKTMAGYQTIMPYLVVQGADQLVQFLKTVFRAEEKCCIHWPDGGVMHAEMGIGESTVLLSDATPRHEPIAGGLYIYVHDADEVYDRALAAGAVSLMAPKDRDYDVREAGFRDSFGNNWWVATPV